MKPYVFSPEEIYPILDGKKTQTRKVVTNQPKYLGNNLYSWQYTKEDKVVFKNRPMQAHLNNAEKPCKVGELLWVRESWAEIEDGIIFKADHPDMTNEEVKELNGEGWKTPIHLKKENSRINLKVTSITLERLFDITEQEAQAEGVSAEPVKREDQSVVPSYREGFLKKWKEKDEASFQSNPFVWVIEFKVEPKKGESNAAVS